MLNKMTVHSVASIVSHLLSPAGIAVLVLLGLPLQANDPAWTGLVLGLYVAIPLIAMAILSVRGSRAGDFYDPGPSHRRRLLAMGVVIYAVSAALLWALGAPGEYKWAGATFFVGAAIVWLVNFFWKVSIHATGAGGAVGILFLAAAPGWPLAMGLPVLVGWARLARGAHNASQVISGTLLGAAVAWFCQFAAH
jgi:membrane-associated phospholipid phosphatase